MKRMPRLVPCVALACSLALPVLATSAFAAPPAPTDAGAPPAATPAAPSGAAAPAPAAPAPAAPPAGDAAAAAPAVPPATAPADAAAAPTTAPAAPEVGANETTAQLADDFWHYGEIGRYDLQAQYGAKVIAAGQQTPEDVLKAFEAAAPNHHSPGGAPGDIDTALLRWQNADPKMKQVAADVIGVLNKARFARRQNPEFIAEQIKRLTGGERAFSLAMQQLQNSGELAVPQLVAALLDPAPGNGELRDVARAALVRLGKSALNPLLAATQMDARDPALTTICGVLGEIQYPVAAPYLISLARSSESSAEVREAATVALRHLSNGPSANAGAGDLFYGLAQQLYQGKDTSLQPDPRSPKAFIWYWQNRGLVSKAIPPQIFNDVMTMREAEYSLRQQGSNPDQAVALWLAANIRRGLNLPAGETDPTRGADEPASHYYNVAEGAKYLNLVLERSLNDSSPQGAGVALAAIKSLQNIVGQSNLFSGTSGQPLVDAMRSPDRQVRFEAAYAIGAALPQKSFQGQDNVVPLLAEAVGQSGTAGVLVVGSQEERARIASELKNYAVDGGADASAAISNAGALPGVDVIVMSEDIGNPQIDSVMSLASQNPRLSRVAKLIIVHSLASPWVRISLTNPTLSYTEATAGQPLMDAVEQARKKAGGSAMDPKAAADSSLRAAHLLARLAISRGQVLNLSVAEPTLLSSLGDKRAEVVQAVGDAVALLNSPRAQSALAQRAADANTPPEIRVALYKSLATSAKFYGNHLEAGTLGELQQVVVGEKDLNIRSAAAEARGALNLPSAEVKSLILDRHD